MAESKNPTIDLMGALIKSDDLNKFIDNGSLMKDVNFDGIKEKMKKESDERKLLQELENFELFTDRLKQAKIFLKKCPFFYDKHKLWWFWNNKKFRYEKIDEVDLLNTINEITKINIVSSKIREEILRALQQEGRKNVPEEPKPSWVQIRNKIIDVETMQEFDASPTYFICNPIDYEIGTDITTPEIDKLFISWVGEEHKDELYELIAFCLVPNYFIHRIFCLIGSGANGKSTFLKILDKVIGRENITSSGLYQLINVRFEGSKLLKKLVCIMGETNFGLLNNTDLLKKLTGQDLIRAEFKGKDSFDFENYAKLVIATNSLPPTADKTEGFYRRWKIIEFPNKFTKEKNVLADIPEEEYKNLLYKCVNLAKILYLQRTFMNEGSFDERKKRYEEKSNPMMVFIKENYTKNINGYVLFSDFFESLNNYLEQTGNRLLSAPFVSKQLKSEGFELKTTTFTGVNGKYILGLRVKVNEVNEVNVDQIHFRDQESDQDHVHSVHSVHFQEKEDEFLANLRGVKTDG